MAKDRIEKHIKLTLKRKYHADVIAILDGIEPSKVASAVIEALRVWQRGGMATSMGTKARSESPPAMEAAVPIVATPVAPPQLNRSKVSLSVGFDALSE